jgi:hypothetical protein
MKVRRPAGRWVVESWRSGRGYRHEWIDPGGSAALINRRDRRTRIFTEAQWNALFPPATPEARF